ncbi:hypothetical protein HR065_00935 [Candidatus Phytoplasma pruni]|uniref:Uncharacterized protein n=1 Tax=Candidatus Phytoplasma pruni TaxID=479893 RepID=A0A851HJN5_9MOLU|nr:hypothetical protein [Candidatus Phytoplasma pruni]
MFVLLLFFIIYFSFFYNKEQKSALPTDKLVADVQNNLEEYVKSKDFNDILDNKFQEKLDENKLTQEEKQETFIIDESQNEELNTEDTTLNSDEEAITESKEKTKKNTKWNFFGKKSKKNDKKDEQTDIIEKKSDSSEVEDKIKEEMAIQQEPTQQ